MNNTNTKLSEVLNIDPIESFEIVDNNKIEEEKIDNVIDDDADYARKNIRELIEKGNSAIDNLLLVAKQSEHPRAFEVAAGLIKNLSDLNKDLLEIQKRKKDLSPSQTPNKSNINVDKAVFIGSTTELLKQLKGK